MTGAPCLVAGTTPYPWPWDGELAAHRLALVVTGMDPGWRHRTTGTADVTAALVRLAVAVQHVGGLVVAVGHPEERAPLTAPPAPEPLPAPVVAATASGVDGCYGGPLDRILRAASRDQLLLAGFGLETTVHSTMRSANDRGYECLLVLDACAPVDPQLTAAARSMVEMSGGIFGAVGTVADVVDALHRLDRAPDRPPA